MMFTVGFDTAICITSWDDKNRGRYLSFRVAIFKNGKEYIATGDNIYRLHEDNTFAQNKWVRERVQSFVTPVAVVDPDVSPQDFPIPEKTAFILAALSAAAPEQQAKAA